MGVYLQWNCLQFTQSAEHAKVMGSSKNSILFVNHQPSTTEMTSINHSLTISQQPILSILVLHSDEAFWLVQHPAYPTFLNHNVILYSTTQYNTNMSCVAIYSHPVRTSHYTDQKMLHGIYVKNYFIISIQLRNCK